LASLHTESDGADAGAVQAGKALGKAVGLGIDDEVDAALAVQRDRLVAVLRDGFEAHAFEQRAHGRRVRRGVFNELESVGAHRVIPGFGHGKALRLRGVHGVSSWGSTELYRGATDQFCV
jgi:hypothetical protein